MKNLLSTTFAIIIFLSFSINSAYAQSDYVLPYPSFMPSSTFYKLHLVLEEIQRYWYFGDFSQFTYNLKESDKYLVEAKTLFEYKQYLFANLALKKSDSYIVFASGNLSKAEKEGKNIDQKKKILKSAALKHIEVLENIKQQVPRQFTWSPEKQDSQNLNLWDEVDTSMSIRKSCL